MSSPTDFRQRLGTLAKNLWWTWNREAFGLFRDLDPELWHQVNHNPVLFLKNLPEPVMTKRIRALGLENRILGSLRRMQEYLASQNTWGDLHGGVLKARPVAYFCAEFGLHESLPLYSGGLGILAGDHLKAASDLGIPLLGIGIYYAQGYFQQHLDQSGWQQEDFGTHDPATLPLECPAGPGGALERLAIPTGDGTVTAQVRRVAVGRSQLFLLDTDLSDNSPAFRDVTHRLYWGDQESRIRQELVLGIGGMRLLKALGLEPSVYHLNEGHSAFALLEAIRQVMESCAVSFEEARERVGHQAVFTTHTPVPAGHDRFDPDLVLHHLGWMREALGLGEADFLGLGRQDPKNAQETFCMTVLALKLAQRVNAVSHTHGRVSRRMWQDLWPAHRVEEVPIGHITNGVHLHSWIAPEVCMLLDRHLGPDWNQRLSRERTWTNLRAVRDDELWELHNLLKRRLIAFTRRRFREQEERRGADPGRVAVRAGKLLDQRALTIGFARRFATYKRGNLLLRQKERLAGLVASEERPLQFIFAGKAHPRDQAGKEIIQEIAALQEEEPFAGRLVFIENYDINVGRHLVQGVDVWLNTPQRPKEACGTSGMKAMLNGVLNLSILDGWWAEAHDGKNGFAIPSSGPHHDPSVQDERDLEALFKTLEAEVIPLYYKRDQDGLPRPWIARMQWAFRSLAWRYSADRMLMDYTRHCYLPAAGGTS